MRITLTTQPPILHQRRSLRHEPAPPRLHPRTATVATQLQPEPEQPRHRIPNHRNRTSHTNIGHPKLLIPQISVQRGQSPSGHETDIANGRDAHQRDRIAGTAGARQATGANRSPEATDDWHHPGRCRVRLIGDSTIPVRGEPFARVRPACGAKPVQSRLAPRERPGAFESGARQRLRSDRSGKDRSGRHSWLSKRGIPERQYRKDQDLVPDYTLCHLRRTPLPRRPWAISTNASGRC